MPDKTADSFAAFVPEDDTRATKLPPVTILLVDFILWALVGITPRDRAALPVYGRACSDSAERNVCGLSVIS